MNVDPSQAERLVNAMERIAGHLDRFMVEEYGEEDTPQPQPSFDTGAITWVGTVITLTEPHSCGGRQARADSRNNVRCFGCGNVLAIL